MIQSTFEYELHIILINSAILLFLHVCLWAVTYHLLHSIRSRLFVIIYLVAVLGHFRWSEFFLSRLDIRERNILSRIVCRTSIIHWSISLISILLDWYLTNLLLLVQSISVVIPFTLVAEQVPATFVLRRSISVVLIEEFVSFC